MIRIKRSSMAAWAVAVVLAVFGAGLAAASPAAAASAWVPYGNTNPITSSNSRWECGPTRSPNPGVGAQACVIRSDHGYGGVVQAAVIVRNSTSSLYGVEVAVVLADYSDGRQVGRWECSRSGVAANSWSVCFGPSFEYGSLDRIYALQGGANGTYLPGSPYV